MLTRSSFKKPAYERKRTVHQPIPENMRRPVSFARADEAAEPVEKDNPLRSEAYRRLVAALPCAYCRKEGRSQHAHNNACKAKGMKNDDRDAMPLCADEPGTLGCHSRFDRYALFLDRAEHVRMGKQWAAETRQKIESMGLWPKNLPRWSE